MSTNIQAEHLYQRMLLSRVNPFNVQCTKRTNFIRNAIDWSELKTRYGMSDADILEACRRLEETR